MRAGAKAKEPRPRVRLLDALRGFSVISMVGYHAMYDMVYLYGVNAPWYRGLPGYLWQQSICWVFILVAGAALHYSRSVAKHGAIVLGCAMVLTGATALAAPNLLISFGVLHMLGCAMLLAALLMPLLKKIPPVAGLIAAFALFALTKTVPEGALGVLDWPLAALPEALYETVFLFPLGFPGPGFFSSDYFPLLPWFFLFLSGWFGWGLLKGRAKTAVPGKNPLEWVGRHSLIIYMLHQPLTMGVLMLLEAAGAL